MLIVSYIVGNNVKVFLNGATDSIGGSTTLTGITSNVVDIGAGVSGSSTRSGFLDGDVAEVAVWNVQLTNDEIAALAAGTHPLRIRPRSIVKYYPLWGIGAESALDGSSDAWTNNGSTSTGAHPPINPYQVQRNLGGPDVLFPTVYTRTITEQLDTSETALNNVQRAFIIFDTLKSLDVPKVGWKVIISEALNYSENFIIDWIISVVDQLFLNASSKVSGQYKVILIELLEALDSSEIYQLFLELIGENLNLSESLIDFHKKLLIVKELLNLQETVTELGIFQHFISEEVSLSESLQRLFGELIGDAFNISEVIDDRVIFLSLLSEDFNVSDILAEAFTANVVVTDTVQGTDSVGNQGTFFILSNDQIIYKSELIISGQAFACWVLTTKEYNPSIYSNFDFNSYARINEKLYGAREDGIYLLEGTDDAGGDIHTGLLFDFANMDIPATKRLRSIHLGAKNPVSTVQVETDRGINKTYKTNNQRAVIGREVKGKFWTITLEDIDNLKSMELNLVFISKKR
jgi:hypothetical protein